MSGDNTYERRRLWKAGKRHCAYCGLPLVLKTGAVNMLTVDHVVPRVKGGITEPGNTVPACVRCNARKADALEFKRWGW